MSTVGTVRELVGIDLAPLVGGRSAGTDEDFAVHDPATGRFLASVGDSGPDHARAAVAAADGALRSWAGAPAWQRFEVLRSATGLLRERTGNLAEVICSETGKPLAEARAEALNTVRFFEWFSHETLRLPGQVWPEVASGRDALVLQEPVGVVVAITPWNFPAFTVACKVGAALAAGCTVVLKPAPQTPLTALAIAAAFTDAGLPAGVLNVLPSSDPARISDVLLRAPEVACISVTGSRRVGELVMREAAASIKRVLLELGGNAAVVVLPGADPALTARELVRARYLNSGQACMAANRVYVVDDQVDALVAELRERVAEILPGDPRAGGTTMGPLIDLAAVERLEEQLSRARSQGCVLVAGGSRTSQNSVSAYFEPTVLLADADRSPAAFREEFFGPVLNVIRCRDTDEAVRLANDTDYGLAGYVFGGDQVAALDVARRLRVGSVGVNTPLVSEPALPFGGVGSSGLGRERGRAGVEEYLETKTIQLPSAAR